MISDERLEFKLKNPDICTGDEIEMAREILALRKIQGLPTELPCNVTIGATTFREGVQTINLLKAIHRRSLWS